MSSVSLPQHSWRTVIGALSILLLSLLAIPSDAEARSPEPTVLRGKMLTEVDELGNATTTIRFKPNVQLYTMLKQSNVNTSVLLRQLGMTTGWGELEDLQGKFLDTEHTIEISFRQIGVCREVGTGRWVMPKVRWTSDQVVASYDREIIMNSVMSSPMGFASMVSVVRCPEGAGEIVLNDARHQLQFDYEPVVESGDDGPEIDLQVETKRHLMSSLAKSYSNEEFGHMWAARSVMVNRGDAPLEDFRIRFRVGDLSSWSTWHKTHRVYPGQSVVDPFFPVFDLNKLAAMDSSRPVMIQVEYGYRDADGRRVTESESLSVDILARNEAVFSNLPKEDCLTFEDRFENIAPLIASMTTPTDPVIQQLVGRLHGQATQRTGHGIAASASNDGAMEYMQTIHEFLAANKVAYQTPPMLFVDGQTGQHIKYGRDVLKNRAGTCIDLTILWLSLLQSAGLEPVGIVIPGHAFPAVRLPSGDLVAIESTMLDESFEDAIRRGMENLAETETGDSIFVDITQLHGQGVTSLDLPRLPVDFLEQMNYKFPARNAANGNTISSSNERSEQTNREQETKEVEETSHRKPLPREGHPLTGCWSFSGQHGEHLAVIVIDLAANGDCDIHIELSSDARGRTEWEGSGWWSVESRVLILELPDETLRWPVSLSDGVLTVDIKEIGMEFDLEPLQID